jgi:S-DNA-T family DNA segregation ATPase FtsK/SpoIIIE
LDSTTQAALEKRGKELLGFAMIAVSLVVAMMLGSYSPDDPSWVSATDAPVANLLGRPGAAIAALVFMIIGMAGWAVAIVIAAWGVRFAFHYGAERLIGRLIFSPIAVAIASIYASTLVPGDWWTHSFGLGGLFGDTVLGAFLNLVPINPGLGVRLMSLFSGVGGLFLLAFVMGLTRAEATLLTRFAAAGLIMTLSALLALIGLGATQAARAAKRAQADRADRKATRDQRLPEMLTDPAPTSDGHRPILRAEPPLADQITAQPDLPEAKPDLFKLMPDLQPSAANSDPEPELYEAPVDYSDIPEGEHAGGDERIKAKITDIIKTRVRRRPPVQIQPDRPEPVLSAQGRIEPQLTMPQRQEPLVRTPTDQVTPTEDPEVFEAEAQFHRPDPLLHAPNAPQAEMSPMASDAADTALIQSDFAVVEDLDVEEVQTRPIRTSFAPVHPVSQPAPADDRVMEPPQPAPAAQISIPLAEPKRVVQHPSKKPVQPSRQAKAEAQPTLKFEDNTGPAYEMPPLSLLAKAVAIQRNELSDEALEENARMLESVLDDYGVKGEIVSVRPGPVVTMYELEPAPGLKASRVIGLADDIARSMSALSARVSTVPGRSVIGIELPNANREKVMLREILSARDFGDSNMRLPLALGKDIGGDAIVANLAKMPHLLIAGTTGSGKSVAINTMILSLLYKLKPDECRLIMIDPKMLELSVYDGIPHLLSPVVTDPKKAVVALKWVVGEMEERYRKMSKMGVRNIEGYNGRVRDALDKGEMFSRTIQTGFDDETGDPIFETEEFAPELLPFIVVIVDEMADLMMVAGKEIEACIQRLAQMARASGIHLIMATQRPSVDVITGTIKANFPTRISFQVTSKIDSRTILGEMGAEQLLGMGDMLYMAGGGRVSRVHGPFVSDEEVEEIVTYLKAYGPPEYVNGVVTGPDDDKENDIDMVLGLGGNTDGEDALYDQAVAIVLKDRKCSTSYIQRKLAIGYNKAARLVEQMEDQGLVSPANHVGKREILVPEQS